MTDELSPAQKLGYEIGDKFEVIEESCYFAKGTIVTFVEDDWSDCPAFEGETVNNSGMSSPVKGMHRAYKELDTLRKLTPAQAAGLVVGKKYKVISMHKYSSGPKIGDIVTFSRDDGSVIPWFTMANGADVCPYITSVEPYIEPEFIPCVPVTPQPDMANIMEKLRIRHLDATMGNSVAVEFTGFAVLTPAEYEVFHNTFFKQ